MVAKDEEAMRVWNKLLMKLFSIDVWTNFGDGGNEQRKGLAFDFELRALFVCDCFKWKPPNLVSEFVTKTTRSRPRNSKIRFIRFRADQATD